MLTLLKRYLPLGSADEAKDRFLAVWGARGVACGIGRTWWGRPTLEARLQDPALSIRDVPRWFDGYRVRADFVGEVSFLGIPGKSYIPFFEGQATVDEILPEVYLARDRFLAQWGPRGVACDIRKNEEGQWTFDAHIQSPALRVHDLPRRFEGYEVRVKVLDKALSSRPGQATDKSPEVHHGA